MKILALIILVFLSQNAIAKQVELPNTEIHYIKSKANDINYELYISLPKNYNKDGKKVYPVVYLLDRDYSFAIAHNIFEHLSDRKDLHESILVGIGYIDQAVIPDYKDKAQLSNYKINRTRDYTPIQDLSNDGYGDEYGKFSGGADKFKQFIKNELIPFITKKYRTSPEKTIAGHSYGGLFATWVYLTDNKMFNNYVAISPSLWYNDNYVFSLINLKNINKDSKIYLTVGNKESKRMIAGVEKMAKILPKNNTYTEILRNENHNTIFPIGLIHGMKKTTTSGKKI